MWCGRIPKNTRKPGEHKNYEKRKNKEIPLLYVRSSNVVITCF